jgi:hypothetical protein
MDFQNNSMNKVQSAYGSWNHAGPNNVDAGIGRINRIAFDPNSSVTAFAGSAGGGLFRTYNEGVGWHNVSGFMPSLGVSGIVVSHNNSQVIYVLTGDGDAFASRGFTFSFGYIRYSTGVLKSTDGGDTWYATGAFPDISNSQYVGFQLTQDPNNANTLIAATSKGMFRTTNGGSTWAHCQTSNGDNKRTFDVKYKPGNSSTVYCTYLQDDATSCVFAKSENGGASFVTTGITYNVAITNADRIVIGVTPANSAYVYLLCGPGYVTSASTANDTFKGLYRSTNSGVDFTRRSNSPDILAYQDILQNFENQSRYDLALAVSPTNANRVIAGGLVVWSSANGGTTWDEKVDYFEDIDNSNYIHPDVHELSYNPINGKLFACTDGGVAVSSDNGDNWVRRFTGLSCTQFYHFEPANEDGYLWGGTQDNGILIREGLTNTYDEFDGGDGYDVMTDVAPAGNYNDKWWVINKSIWADGTTDIDVTPDQVNTDDPINYFPNLAMSPTNEDVIYAGYPTLYISYSRGDNWASFENPIVPRYKIPGNWSVSACPTNRKRFYTAGDNRTSVENRKGLWRLDNLDDILPDEITNLTPNLVAAGYPTNNPKITDIAVSSNTSNRLWVTVGGFTGDGYTERGKVFYSNNAGNSWIDISLSLPDLPIHTIVADDNDNIYVGNEIGVYYKGVNDANWIPFYNGLPRVAVSELEFFTTNGFTTLYASTFGRGIWISDVFSNCTSDLTIASNQQGQKFYQAGSTITSTSSVSGGTGTNVFFKAGSSVTLGPGFIVNPNTVFTAYIGACNTGSIPLKTATGDSTINITRNIKAARDYGFVTDAVAEGAGTVVTVNISNSGNYSIRLFDADAGIYLSSSAVNFSTGINKKIIQVKIEKGRSVRADLFKDDVIVHYSDVSSK